MTVERILRDQASVRDASLALAALVDRADPPDREELQAARWRVARELLRLLPAQDRLVYARLRLHPDPLARMTGAQFAHETTAIYAAFEAHTERWTLDAALADWPAYRRHVKAQAGMVVDRLAREEEQLLPLLAGAPEVPEQRAPGDRNWAGDGWAFRARLELPGPATQAA